MTDTPNPNSPDFPQDFPSSAPVFGRGFTTLDQMQSNPMLKGTPTPTQLQAIREALDYPLLDRAHPLSPLEALHALQLQAAEIPQIKLKHYFSPGEENSYHVDLTMSYEQYLKQGQRVSVLATAFLGHLKANLNRLSKISPVSIFQQILPQVVQEATNNPTQIIDTGRLLIAAEQFYLAVDATRVELAADTNATTQLIKSLKAGLKLATEMYQLGLDQIKTRTSQSDSRIPDSSASGGGPIILPVPPVQPDPTETQTPDVDRVQEQAKGPIHQRDDSLAAVAHGLRAKVEGAATAHAQSETKPETSEEVPVCKHKTAKEARAKGQHVKGDPLPVKFNVDIAAPGITGNHEGVIVRKGNTKLQLTAQADPAENGTYRYMGADQPLVRIDSIAAIKQPATKAIDPLVRLDAIVPDIVTPNEDLPGEELDDQIDGSSIGSAGAPDGPTRNESQDCAPPIAAGAADDGRTADGDLAGPTPDPA